MVKVMLPTGEKILMDLDTWLALPWPRYLSIQPSGHVHVMTVLHRLVIGAEKHEHVDHINGNPLDNRLENLRACTIQQNRFNSKKPKGCWSKYKGVDRAPRSSGWRARIMFNGKSKYLGSYSTEELAAAAYNEAAKQYFGEYAYLNKIEE